MVRRYQYVHQDNGNFPQLKDVKGLLFQQQTPPATNCVPPPYLGGGGSTDEECR